MIHSRGANGSDAEVVWTQILQGIGGGFAAVTSQVGAQAFVPHADVAMVKAVVLLITKIGGWYWECYWCLFCVRIVQVI